MPNAAQIGHELTEIRGDSWWFARFSLTTVIKKVQPCFGGISSKMNDPRMSAVIFVNSWDSGPVWNRGIKQYFLHILSLETDKNPYWNIYQTRMCTWDKDAPADAKFVYLSEAKKFCFVCLIWFFTSTQQSFSYAGRVFLGWTSTKLG